VDTPEQLRAHAGLLTARHATRWTLHGADARTVQVEPQVALVGNESQLLIAAAERVLASLCCHTACVLQRSPPAACSRSCRRGMPAK
jgi:hypothetical protein